MSDVERVTLDPTWSQIVYKSGATVINVHGPSGAKYTFWPNTIALDVIASDAVAFVDSGKATIPTPTQIIDLFGRMSKTG